MIRKKGKTIVSGMLGALALLLVGGGVALANGNAETASAETTPTLSIVGKTLSLKDNVHIKFAVSATNVETETAEEFGVLVWNAPQEEYSYGTQATLINTQSGETTNGEQTYPTFSYTELSAKEMTDVIYVRAYVNVAGEYYYSDVTKYSILEYSYIKLGKTEEAATTDAELKELLNNMLAYGASAQKYANYKEETLATDTFSYVRLENATFADEFSYGLFKAGTSVEVIPADGYEMATPADGFEVSETGTIMLTVPNEMTVYDEVFTEIGAVDPDPVLITKTYVFANYDEGTQYAENEVHALDEYVTVTTTQAHFTSELRLYSSSTHDGFAIISATRPITSLVLNAGNKADTLNVYGLESDGETWTLIEGVEITSTSYKDYTVNMPEGTAYTQLKLDVVGTSQVRVASFTLTMRELTASQGLTFALTEDDTYKVTGIGTCEDTEIIIPATYEGKAVTGIDENALSYKTMTSVVIPDSVTYINSSAFYACPNLTSVTIGSGVTQIGELAFADCDSLTDISVSTANTAYQSIESSLYTKDGITLVQYANGKTDATVVLNQGNTIGAYAFDGETDLTTLVVGAQVMNIQEYAFRGADNLATVYYKGTAAQWGEIVIGVSNDTLTSATIYYYSETEPEANDEKNLWYYNNDVPTLWASSAEKVAAEKAALTIENTEAVGDTQMTLKTEASNKGVTIAWSENHENASIENGTLTLTDPDEDTTVVVTATITCGSVTETKEFTISLLAPGVMTDEEKVASAKELLTLETSVKGGKEIALTTETGIDGVTVVWSVAEHTNATIEENVLKLTDPDDDTTVVVTATITCGEVTDTKEFTIALEPAIRTLTIAEVLAATPDDTTQYYVIGKVTEVYSTMYGNMYITDGTNTLTVYGTYDADGNRYDVMENKPVAGDTVKFLSIINEYSGVNQLKNAVVVEITPMPDEEKVAAVLDELTVGEEVIGGGNITLKNTTAYSGVTITWALDQTYDNATLTGNVLALTNPAADTAVIVVVTVTCGETMETKTFTIQLRASAVSTKEVTFEFGADGSASHSDGSTPAVTSYTETVDGYTLTLSSPTNVYKGARDAKGNSCLKLGTGSKAASFSFTVADNVDKVIIRVAQYKANTTKITVNGTAYTISTASDNGAYTEIVVDTSTTKTVSFATVSGGQRAMINSITFVATM